MDTDTAQTFIILTLIPIVIVAMHGLVQTTERAAILTALRNPARSRRG